MEWQLKKVCRELKKVNKKKAIAVKALQEIEGFLFAPKNDYEAIIKAYMTASVALEKIDYPKEED